MKVAVCLSGGIRYPHIGLKSLESIFPNDDIKVFIHTWRLSNRENFLNTVSGLQYKEKDNTVTSDYNYLSNYNYESLLIEDYESKKIKFESLYKSLSFKPFEEIGCIVPRYDVGPFSMHYSIHKSNELKRQYEKENNMTFDCVIRMRFDSDFDGKVLNLSNMTDGLYIPEGEDWCGGINDQFALGSSSAIDVYSDFLNHIHLLQECMYHPESMLRRYFEIKSLPVNRFNFRVIINNKIDFRRVMFGG